MLWRGEWGNRYDVGEWRVVWCVVKLLQSLKFKENRKRNRMRSSKVDRWGVLYMRQIQKKERLVF